MGYIALMGVVPIIRYSLCLLALLREYNYWVTLHSWMYQLSYSLICLLALPVQNNGLYCIMGVVPIIRYSLCLLALRIESIGSHCTHGCAT